MVIESGDYEIPNNQNEKHWDHVWTTDEIRNNSTRWTLAGDVGLFNLLNEISQNIISRTHEVENSIDALVHKTKIASVRVNNVINDFHMLSNLQFVENRVYDEEASDNSVKENTIQEKSKEQKEAETLARISEAMKLGLNVLEDAFYKINMNDLTDSEDEDLSSEGNIILEPKNPYENQPLPYIIGSEEFERTEHVGLHYLVEEDNSAEYESVSEIEETSSEEEDLPMDNTNIIKQNEKKVSQDFNDKASSNDNSEIFGSENENGFGSDVSLEKKESMLIQKNESQNELPNETKRASISSIQPKFQLPQVLPVSKKQVKEEKDDLFFNDDVSDDESSPFNKKSGLFKSDIRFDDDEDKDLSDDLFGEKPKRPIKVLKIESNENLMRPSSPSTKKEESLFADDESDDDIFNKLISKRPSKNKKSNDSQEASEKADSSSTPSSAPSIKTSNNTLNLLGQEGNADSLFGDESDDDLFSTIKSQKKFDFTGMQDDLFDSKSDKSLKTPKKTEENTSLIPEKNAKSLFDDSSDEKTEENTSLIPEKNAKSLFDDSSDEEVKKENVHTPNMEQSPIITKTVNKKTLSLFDDDDDDNDIFSQINKKELTTKSFVKDEINAPSLFEKDLKHHKHEKITKSSLLDNEPSSPSLLGDSLPIKKKKLDKSSIQDNEQSPPGLFADDLMFNKNEKSDKSSLQSNEQNSDILFGEDLMFDKKKQVTKSLFQDDENNLPNLFESNSLMPNKSEIKKSLPIEKKSSKTSLFDESYDAESGEPTITTTNSNILQSSLFEKSDNFDLFSPKSPGKKDIVSPSVKEKKLVSEKSNFNKVHHSLFEDSDNFDLFSPKSPLKKANSVSPTKQDIPDIKPTSNDDINKMDTNINSQIKQSIEEDSVTLSSEIGFDLPIDSSKTLNVISKDRVKVAAKRRKPTRKGRLAALQKEESDDLLFTDSTSQSEDSMNLIQEEITSSPKKITESSQLTYKQTENKKKDLMSQLISEVATSKIGKKTAMVIEDDDDLDIFSAKPLSKQSDIKLESPVAENRDSKLPTKSDKNDKTDAIKSESSDNDDFFAEPSFQGFRESISRKDSVFDQEEDDDDDDLFKIVKATPSKVKIQPSESNDIFSDEVDIFAGMSKEKYEMFPSQLYDDEDDIFGADKSQVSNNVTNKEVKTKGLLKKDTKENDIFDDPLRKFD